MKLYETNILYASLKNKSSPSFYDRFNPLENENILVFSLSSLPLKNVGYHFLLILFCKSIRIAAESVL